MITPKRLLPHRRNLTLDQRLERPQQRLEAHRRLKHLQRLDNRLHRRQRPGPGALRKR